MTNERAVTFGVAAIALSILARRPDSVLGSLFSHLKTISLLLLGLNRSNRRSPLRSQRQLGG